MFIEASSPRKPGEIAKLVVAVPNNGKQSCLSFYYHMYGATAGTLNVYSGSSKVLSASGNKGDNWLMMWENIYLEGVVSKILPLTDTLKPVSRSSDPESVFISWQSRKLIQEIAVNSRSAYEYRIIYGSHIMKIY